jgi:serine/threonine protein kinase
LVSPFFSRCFPPPHPSSLQHPSRQFNHPPRGLADLVLAELGKGTFGRVLLCEDTSPDAPPSQRLVAIKVVRRIAR